MTAYNGDKYFIIESVSIDGTYFLVNGWQKAHSWWHRKYSPYNFYKTRAGAIKSLKALIKTDIFDYEAKFSLVEVDFLGRELNREQIF